MSRRKNLPAGKLTTFRARPLVCATATDNRLERSRKDLQIHAHRPVVDVAQIQTNGFIPVEIGPAADLPQPGEAGLNLQPAKGIG